MFYSSMNICDPRECILEVLQEGGDVISSISASCAHDIRFRFLDMSSVAEAEPPTTTEATTRLTFRSTVLRPSQPRLWNAPSQETDQQLRKTTCRKRQRLGES